VVLRWELKFIYGSGAIQSLRQILIPNLEFNRYKSRSLIKLEEAIPYLGVADI